MPIDPTYRIGATQTIASGAGSTASTAFGAFTTQVRIVSSAAVQYRLDAAPTAVTTDTYLPANWVEVITVSPGQKIAVIGTATVNITEVG